MTIELKYQCTICGARLTGTTPSCPYCFGKIKFVEMTEQEDEKEFEEWYNSEEARDLRRMDAPYHKLTWLASRRTLREKEDKDGREGEGTDRYCRS